MKVFERKNYIIELSDAEMYVDNKSRKRSGHMSHALAEFAPDCFIDFNSNCSPIRGWGHSAYGWIEYRISKDAGQTYSDVKVLPYSKQMFEDGINTISVEKAVACDDGTIVAFCLKNDCTALWCCEPWATPSCVISCDGGESWSEAFEVSPYCGRIYDAVYRDGVIYALEFCNDNFAGSKPEHLYRIFISEDNGKTFKEHCVVPFKSTAGLGYGAMIFDESGRLHVYAYNTRAERDMAHITSDDCGKTWNEPDTCRFEKGIRNPQIGFIDGVYVIHGRGEKDFDFVLYTSEDGCIWDTGEYIYKGEKEACFYSNNITLCDPNGGKRMLIQYSDHYELKRVNVMHRWLKIRKK